MLWEFWKELSKQHHLSTEVFGEYGGKVLAFMDQGDTVLPVTCTDQGFFAYPVDRDTTSILGIAPSLGQTHLEYIYSLQHSFGDPKSSDLQLKKRHSTPKRTGGSLWVINPHQCF